jgi:large subunit ribosomal protein L23
MKLSIYDIIKGPKITEKSYSLNKSLNKLVLNIHMSANKNMVKEVLKKLFNVEVEKVNILVRKPKLYKRGKFRFKGILRKTAIVTLKPGYNFEQLGMADQNVSQLSEDIQK